VISKNNCCFALGKVQKAIAQPKSWLSFNFWVDSLQAPPTQFLDVWKVVLEFVDIMSFLCLIRWRSAGKLGLIVYC
jgi:hypothetical protein